MEAVCIELGLRYEEIIDFPSWWYPGQTTLLLYTPLADQQAPSEDHRSGAREAVQLALWSGDEGLQKMHRRRMTKARLR